MRFLLSAVLVVATACTGNINNGGGAGDDDAPPRADAGPGEFEPPADAQVCDQTVPITVTQTQRTPDVLLVVDKSGSMGEALTGANSSKMDVMKQALAQVLPTQDQNIHFGLATYPSAVDQCSAATVLVPVAANNAGAVITQINAVTPGGATPTFSSLDAAGSYYSSIPVNADGRFVLLATDGLPNCNGTPQTPSQSQTIQAAQRLSNVGIKVFVIGFGDVASADPVFLQQLAQAGGTGNFFAADSPTELQNALLSISGTVVQASCSFELASRPQDESKLAVTLDGQAVPRDPSHATGWDYDAGANSITFYGDTCNSIQTGTGANVGVDYGCGGVIIGKR
jgi:Mg-chelatase subunit ChlD